MKLSKQQKNKIKILIKDKLSNEQEIQKNATESFLNDINAGEIIYERRNYKKQKGFMF